MKKLFIFAVAIAAMAFTSCGGNKSAQAVEETDSIKSFEQEQVEAKIKMELDSLAAELGRLKKLPVIQVGEDGVKLSDKEKQVKPDYLLAPSAAENATTLAEKYRMLSALSVDKTIAAMYEMPVDEYEAAISKLVADINDPAIKKAQEAETKAEQSKVLYKEMEAEGRINFYWIMTSAATVETVYVLSQNVEKFCAGYTDEQVANITFRLFCIIDAVDQLSVYDPQIQGIAEALSPLKDLQATTLADFKKELAASKEKIEASRAAFLK